MPAGAAAAERNHNMQRGLKIITALAGTLLLGCTGYETSSEINGVNYWISSSGKKAFASEVRWNVSDEPFEIRVEQTVGKAEVFSLGGFFGTGVPAPFEIHPEGELNEFVVYEMRSGDYGLPVEYVSVPAVLYLPASLEEIRLSGTAIAAGCRDERGVTVLRWPQVSVVCAEDNPVFDTENGKLYRTDTGEQALPDMDGFDGTIGLRERLCGKYVRTIDEHEKEVWEFWEAFDTIHVHINSYMDDSEYVFSAMELKPEEGTDLSSDADSLTVSARCYSDFAMAGTYTEAEYPRYRIDVNEHSIVLTGLDETGAEAAGSKMELQKDNSQPGQFPSRTEDLARVRGDTDKLVPLTFYRVSSLLGRTIDTDGAMYRFYKDSVIAVKVKGDTAGVWRGTAACAVSDERTDLIFSMHKNGGTQMPAEGRVTVTEQEDHSVLLTPVEGYESFPLIPQGKTEAVLK